jgi:hypothetical protein
LLSYERLSKKPLLFKSFTGFTVHLMIFTIKISKKYAKHENQRLSKRKDRGRDIGAGGHSNLT